MLLPRQPSMSARARRGSTTPMVAAALLVALLGFALVLDRVWLESAQVELIAASEASALGAARALASDDRLRDDVDQLLLVNRALEAAANIASQNTVAGAPVELDLAKEDVRIGTLAEGDESGGTRFLQTDADPTHVLVTAHRTRSHGNPVALFISQLTRQPSGDVSVQAEAGLDNHVAGVRPFEGAPVPALPLAIWRDDPSGQRKDTWRSAIEQRRGRDDYGYDAKQHQITSGADGIPELTLKSQPRSGSNRDVNLQLLDIGTGFDEEKLARQFATGWNVGDLELWQGELRLTASQGIELASTPRLQSAERDALEAMLGEPRIVLLYSATQSVPQTQESRATCVEFVAVRVLEVRDPADGAAEVVVQPTVMTTRTALTEREANENNYIYRMTLTR